MNNLIILKLGGSILSFKEKNIPVFRTKQAERIIREIKTALINTNNKLIIVHGTGSFGHPLAYKYQLQNGLVNQESVYGFTQTKRQATLMNLHLWRLLEKNGLTSISIQPSTIITNKSGYIFNMDLTAIKRFLNLSIIVHLFGDEVFDLDKGYSECSSDQIAAYLASRLKPKRLLYATDVNGVFDLNPKIYTEAKLLKEVNEKNSAQIISSIKPHNPIDVSGEMAGKLSSIFSYSYSVQTEIRIFNGSTCRSILKAFLGQAIGTKIKASRVN